MAAKVELVPQVADPPEGTVVFLIGMRINSFWKVHRWLPSFVAMVPMLVELHKQKEYGFLGARTWTGRTVVVIQYWRSMDELMAYAHDTDAAHRPAWGRFNRTVADNGAVGIYHEAYVVDPARMHTVYRNMPPFGIAAATGSRPQRAVPVPRERGSGSRQERSTT
ncbi:DUF4188 domain-containing protein [Streptomyces sp. TLI_185]|uniref:DUF4188 domain-containing protein n=1 Tax=Streptomyces sp. TLI_185 TaxID=2485151 RepID=UPI000FBB76C5|nr:DUF4188 domain-containing protein [Streptomyces sp. TLI_185]RPF32257.1 uncharacterized protein DUF4188 [Streptomyces sp. TLI_185]